MENWKEVSSKPEGYVDVKVKDKDDVESVAWIFPSKSEWGFYEGTLRIVPTHWKPLEMVL